MNKQILGVVIGRFQTPYLHVGHLHLITTAIRECDKVLIFIGHQDTKDDRNPYTVGERLEMIQKIFPHVYIEFLSDQEGDEQWSRYIDKRLVRYNDKYDIKLYHSRDSFKDSYSGKYPLKEVEEIPGYSATKIRNNEKL